MSRPILNVVAVSGDPERKDLLDALMADDTDYGMVFVESIARGYSRIKQIVPDLIILFSGIEDEAACQLLSMLALDRQLSRVPVVHASPTPVR
jgi:hypothetical protein